MALKRKSLIRLLVTIIPGSSKPRAFAPLVSLFDDLDKVELFFGSSEIEMRVNLELTKYPE